ncbi:unnamed protein product [Penicillium glandicola]
MADNVHEIAGQLEGLTAQSPAAQDASLLSAAQVEATEPALQGSVPNAPEGTGVRSSTPTPSDLTEIDDTLLQDPTDHVAVSQSVSTETHFINPTAPRPQTSPPPAFMSFDRLSRGLAQSSATTSTTATIHPPSLAVERIMGPKQPIPALILQLLEEWHEDCPDTEHPSALIGRAPSTWKNFKVFNHDADESELSIFQITLKGQTRRIVLYRIMVLHAQNAPEELVVYGQPRPKFRGPGTKGTRGLYLLDWLETERKEHVQACGIKLWRTDEKTIIFSARMFDDARKCTQLAKSNDPFDMRAPSSTPKKQTWANEDIEDAGSNSSEPPFSPLRARRQASTSGYSKGETESENRTPVGSFPPWEDAGLPVTTSENQNEFFSVGRTWGPSEKSPWGQLQKRRRSTGSSNDEASAPLRYKLMSDVSDQIRIFKTNDARVVFQKAREFYKGMDKRTGLLCSISGVEGVRYVGEGCVDEFDILQEDIQKSSHPRDENRVVEVRPSVGF